MVVTPPVTPAAVPKARDAAKRSTVAGFHARNACNATIERMQTPIVLRATPSEIVSSSHHPAASPITVAGRSFHTGFQLPCLIKAGYTVRSATISSGSVIPTEAFAP